MFVDSHAHLDFPALRGQREAVLERARAAGVLQILNIVCAGAEGAELTAAAKAAEARDGLWVAAGVHPHDASSMTPQLEADLLEGARHPKVIGWGEIGLDYYYENSPRDVQERVFARQLKLAVEVGKPVIIHSRDAAEPTCRLIEEHFCRFEGHPAGVMHCFTYDQKVAMRCLDMGFYLSFGGIVTFPRSHELREIAKMVPEDRFLIETDSPYLAPVPFRGKTNEPAWVVHVAEKLAEVRGVTLHQIGEQSTRNFATLFQLG